MEAQMSYGVRAGLSYSSLVQRIDGVSESGSRMGYSVAGGAMYQYHRHWGVQSELAFTNQGGSYYSAEEGLGSKAVLNKYRYYSLQVPIHLTYLFSFSGVRTGIFAGPAVDFSLFGKMKSKALESDIDFGIEKEDDLKRFDLGMSAGLFAERRNVFFSIRAFCGLLDRNAVRKADESRLYQSNVTFSLGYVFPSR